MPWITAYIFVLAKFDWEWKNPSCVSHAGAAGAAWSGADSSRSTAPIKQHRGRLLFTLLNFYKSCLGSGFEFHGAPALKANISACMSACSHVCQTPQLCCTLQFFVHSFLFPSVLWFTEHLPLWCQWVQLWPRPPNLLHDDSSSLFTATEEHAAALDLFYHFCLDFSSPTPVGTWGSLLFYVV